MPAKSKKQQRFFGIVHAYLQGKIKNPSESVRRAANSMSDEDVKHFASTKHDGLPEKVAAWLGMFKSAGGTGHEAVRLADAAQAAEEARLDAAAKAEADKHRAAVDHIWSGTGSGFFIQPRDNARRWRIPASFGTTAGEIGSKSLDNPEVWSEVKDLYLDPAFFDPQSMAFTPHGSNVLNRAIMGGVDWGKVDNVTGRAIGARLPEEPESVAGSAASRQEKDGQVIEVDPSNRANASKRARKILDALTSQKEDDKELKKRKKELEEKNRKDVEAVKGNAGTIGKALDVIRDLVGM